MASWVQLGSAPSFLLGVTPLLAKFYRETRENKREPVEQSQSRAKGREIIVLLYNTHYSIPPA